MSEKFDRYTELFLDEASEQIEELNQNLLALERTGYDPEIINEIFRTAHTLKSSAAFVGLEDLSLLAHHMEDLLQLVKDTKLSVNTELVNIFFQCLDRIKVAVAQVSEGNVPEDTFADLIHALDAYATKNGQAPSAKGKKGSVKSAPPVHTPATKEPVELVDDSLPPPSVGKPSHPIATPPVAAPDEKTFIELSSYETKELMKVAGRKKIYDGYVTLDPDSPMKNLRFLLLIQHLNRAGVLYRSIPSESDLDDGDAVYTDFRFVFIGTIAQRELTTLCQVDMVEEVYIVERVNNEIASGDGEQGAATRRQGNDLSAEETRVKTKNIKVSSEKIDYLLNSVGELVITNSGLQKIYEDLNVEFGDSPALGELKSKIDQAARIARDLQSGIMKTRMIPVGLVFQRFTRPVRDLSLELGKEVDLVLQGEDTELDKNIIDSLNDPMLHLIRNSLDHGVESREERIAVKKTPHATLLLNAYQSGNNIFVEIRDDGRGLDKEAILHRARQQKLVNDDITPSDEDIYNLIFAPGFSTAKQVTDVSGRGVGMSVVKRMVQEFKGSIQVQNDPGNGCSFILSFPLTLAIISAILVRVAGEDYAFPLSDVVETIKVSHADITTLQGKDIINLRGDILPVFRLGALMGINEATDEPEFPVVIANSGNRKIGFIVDSMVGKKEIVIKSLEQNFQAILGLIGACLMGDGSIVMVLDVQGLLEIAQSEQMLATQTSQLIFATRQYNQDVHKLIGNARRMTKKVKRGGEIKKEELEDISVLSINDANQTPPPASSGGTTIDMSKTEPPRGSGGGSSSSSSSSSSVATPVAPAVKPKSYPVVDEDTILFDDEPSSSSSASATAVAVKPKLKVAATPAPANGKVSTIAEMEATPSAMAAISKSPYSMSGNIAEDDRVSQALISFERERKERMRKAKEIINPEDISMQEDISESNYNQIYAVINTGMINAGFVLSQLLGVKVEVSVPEFQTVDFSQLTDYIPKEKVIGVTLDTEGDFQMRIFLVFDEATGYKAAGDLMGLPTETWEKGKIAEEDLQSVLSELSNIVGSSILNALANKTNLPITPTVPNFIHSDGKSIVSQISSFTKGANAKVIYVSADFYREDMELLGRLFLLPSRPTLSQLVSKLG